MWNTLSILVGIFFVEAASGAVIAGRIVEDHTGQPVISAEVRIRLVGSRMLSADLETDAEGRFKTPEIPNGDYLIAISKANYAGASLNVNATSAASITVRLIRGGALQGRVTDRDGQPVSNAAVFALTKKSGTTPLKRVLTAGRHGTTNASGRYRLYNLPPGRYVVAVSYGASTTAIGSTGSPATAASLGSGFLFYPDSARPRLFDITGGEETRNIDFHLQPGALYSVSGKVELPEAKGTYWLALTPVDQTAMAAAVTQTKADGQFSFTSIPSGSYHLFASGPTGARSSQGAFLEKDPHFARTRVDLNQNVEGLTIVVEKGRSIHARLSADPESKLDSMCAKTAQLVLSSTEDWGAHLERTTAIDFMKPAAIVSLAPARYSANVTGLAPGCHVASGITIDLSSAGNPASTTIPISPPGAIRGVLRETPGGATVGLLSEDGADPVVIAVPNSDSRFSFAGLHPGRYRVWAQPPEGSPASRPRAIEVEVRGGATIDVSLTP